MRCAKLSAPQPTSHRAQRAPDQSRRPQPATITRYQGIQGLTTTAAECKKLSASEAPDPGRHHVGTPGDIISECPGDFVGIRNPLQNDKKVSGSSEPT
jgi:hypothetical protein